MPDFGLKAAQILGAAFEQFCRSRRLKVCQTLSSSAESSCLVLDATLTAPEIVAQTDVKFQICSQPGAACQTAMPRQELLSPVWPYLMASEAGRWAEKSDSWGAVSGGQGAGKHSANGSRPWYASSFFSYLFRFGHLIHQNYHTHFLQQRLVQFGSVFYLSEN